MKALPLPTAALIALIALGLVAPAGAQSAVPNLKTTAPYKSLKTYVNLLQERSVSPATSAQKATYRQKLTQRRQAANSKVKALFKQRVTQIKRKDDAQERRQVKQIKQSQKSQVTALNASLASRLAGIQSDENAAVNRTTDRYAARINPLADRRAALRRQLSRTRRPARRAALNRQLTTVQNQINTLSNAKQSSINAITTRFNGRSSAAKSQTANKVKNVKSDSARQILAAHRAWKGLFREEFADAKEKRTDNFELVSELGSRGIAAIRQMPHLAG